MNKQVTQWEDELDNLGVFADFQKLVSHLEKAPPKSPSRNYLAGFIAGQKRFAQELDAEFCTPQS